MKCRGNLRGQTPAKSMVYASNGERRVNSIGDPRIVAMFLKAYYEGRESELEIMEEKEAISYLKRHVVSADIYWMATDKEPPRDGKPIFNSTPVIKLEA